MGCPRGGTTLVTRDLRTLSNQGAAAEVDADGKQQLKQMQSESSWIWPHKTSACQRCYHTRAVGASEYRAMRDTLDSTRRGEGGETSKAYLCLQ